MLVNNILAALNFADKLSSQKYQQSLILLDQQRNFSIILKITGIILFLICPQIT